MDGWIPRRSARVHSGYFRTVVAARGTPSTPGRAGHPSIRSDERAYMYKYKYSYAQRATRSGPAIAGTGPGAGKRLQRSVRCACTAHVPGLYLFACALRRRAHMRRATYPRSPIPPVASAARSWH